MVLVDPAPFTVHPASRLLIPWMVWNSEYPSLFDTRLSAYKWYLFSSSQFCQQFKISVTIVALHSSVLKNSTGLSISTSSPATQHLRDSGGESQCPLWNACISHFVEAQLLILKSLPKSPEIPSKAFYWLRKQYFSEEFLLNPPSHLFCTLHLWQLPKTGWAVLIT